MKPNFALQFSHDSIGLLHRTARGWLEIGATPIDAPDLAEALNYLRRSALGLAPHGVATKLVIPDDQILYLELGAPGPTDAHRDAQIRLALEGRTPYDVDDLVFDWSGDGPVVQVAVIARETLQEVEAFAQEYRFNPVSFVALPDPARFEGEPWFGPTAHAASLLQDDEIVERDSEAITIVSRDPQHRDLRPAAPQTEAEPTIAEPGEEPQTEVFVAEIAAPAEELAELVEVVPAPLAEPMPPAAADEPEPDTTLDIELPPAATAEPVPDVVEIAEAEVADAPHIVDMAQTEDAAAAEPLLAEPADDLAPPDDLPTPMDTLLERASVTAPTISDDVPPPPPGPAFATRRNGPDLPAETRPAASQRRMPAAPLMPPPLAASAGVPRSYDPQLDEEAQDSDLPPPVASALQSALAAVRAEAGLAAPPRTPRPAKAGKSATAGAVTAPGISGPGVRSGKPARTSKAAARAEALEAAQTLVAPPPPDAMPFRNARPATRGRPRFMGLILVGLLLLALAAVAAWSSITLSRRAAPEPTAVAEAPAESPDASVIAQNDIPSPDEEAMADGQATEGDLAAAGEAPADPANNPLVQPEAGDTVASTPLPTPEAQDEIILSTMDAPPPATDALAMGETEARADGLPSAPMPPPPFGTLYEFDADGLIRPTPEGIVTPEGVRLVAGKPKLVPPPRPASIAAKAAPVVLPETPATEGAVRVEPYTDPATQGLRPRPRPEGLVPAAAEDAALSVDEPARIASLVPRARPASVIKAAEQARLDDEARKVAEAASLSAAAAAEALAAPAQTEVAALGPVAGGIGISRLPPDKPRNFDRRVQAALAAALVATAKPEAVAAAQPAPEPQKAVASRRSAEPGEDEEPDQGTVAPRIPSSKSVAKNATYVNAIDLGRTNLIGVYGTPSRRYALIRTGSGSYKKVRVGDRIDGGTVAAITDKEVRYQKGGRMIALAMPKG